MSETIDGVQHVVCGDCPKQVDLPHLMEASFDNVEFLQCIREDADWGWNSDAQAWLCTECFKKWATAIHNEAQKHGFVRRASSMTTVDKLMHQEVKDLLIQKDRHSEQIEEIDNSIMDYCHDSEGVFREQLRAKLEERETKWGETDFSDYFEDDE